MRDSPLVTLLPFVLLLAATGPSPAAGVLAPPPVAPAPVSGVPTASGESPAAATATVTTTAPLAAGNDAAPEIVAVYPDPAAPNDAGEFVVVRVPRTTNVSGWVLDDGESTARLPNATVEGRIALSTDPELARNRTDERVLGLSGHLSLANGGETVRLVAANRTVSVAYPAATEGERWHRTADGWRWTRLGATDFDVARAEPADARAFVLPDAPDAPVELLRSADRRLLLAGYTLSSERVADALADAVRRGVAVRVLVEGGPVGGVTRRQARLLDSLADRGVEVRVVGGPIARYRYHHSKYAVADDRALVLTENWKPAGTGGRSSRGWGVALESPALADHLAAVFAADADWRDAIPWTEFREGRTFEAATPANGSYPREISPANVSVDSAEVLVAPDNAERELIDLLDSANRSIRVQQVSIGGRDQPFLRAALRAARRGVEVRILLGSAWYVEEDNRALVAWLNERAADDDLPLEARLADPRGRYRKVHAKGVVADGDAAVVGSLNWNNNSARENREVAVVLRGEQVGEYYADAFDADWRASAAGAGNRLPVGLLAAVAVGAAAAILLGRREVRFEK